MSSWFIVVHRRPGSPWLDTAQRPWLDTDERSRRVGGTEADVGGAEPGGIGGLVIGLGL